MKRIITLLLVALLASLPALAQGTGLEYSLDATGTIEIGPDGAVLDYRLDKGQKPAVAAALDQSIRGWRFEPILVDGRAVIATTRMRLALVATPVGGNEYGLKVNNVWFGEPDRKNRLAPPRYPHGAAQLGVAARVVLVLRLDAHGNVTDVHTEQVSLNFSEPEGRAIERWRRTFEASTVATAKTWKFAITELVDGQPSPVTSVRVPVEYVPGPRIGNQWQAFVPGPRHPIPWGDPSLASLDTALGNGDMQPLDSRFKLTTPLLGALL